ncbi:MAG TPA: ABC transporter permease [Ilumatobacteraceae bacterium]|nr:ABC transporter permease [Ilumatobacteraceae bacterium]
MTESDVSEPDPTEGNAGGQPASRSKLYQEITGVGGRARDALLVPALAVITALLIGGIIIALSDVDNLRLFRTDPLEAMNETISTVWGAYRSMFVGAFGSINAISETLFAATPLILAGLAVAVGFQAGLFNIGAEGQIIIGGMAALYVGFTFDLPGIVLIPMCLAAAIVGGGFWAGIAGMLRAKTGAHEVITTIMLNFIALYLTQWLLKTTVFQQPGRSDPISKPINEGAQLPYLFGSEYRVTIGFLIAIAAAVLVQALMYRSTIGFEFRAVGANADAARYAGMNIVFLTVAVMFTSGALAGLAGANQIMSLPPYQGSTAFSGGIGFDAIALALLGRSKPYGVVWAGILFGALAAGGREMQGVERIPIDLVEVIQALIIVFIAAPALIRSIYRIKTADTSAVQITTGWSA